MTDAIRLEKKEAFAHLILNRPEKRNAFDEAMIGEMLSAIESVRQDKQIRGLILSAAGEHFCAGGDIAWMQRAAKMSERENFNDARQLALLMHQLFTLPIPTLSLVSGAVFGGGLGLVACTDTAIASEEAVFCLSEVRLGLIPAVIGPYVLRAMGPRQAQHYILTARRFNTSVAERSGLIHQLVTSPADLTDAMEQWCHDIISGAPVAQEVAKQFCHEMQEREFSESVIDITAACIASVRNSAEGQEGTAAFLEKRLPSWRVKA